MSNAPPLGLRLALAADAGLLPVALPAPGTELHNRLESSAAGWQVGLEGDALWLRRDSGQDMPPRWWCLRADGVTAGDIQSAEARAAATEATVGPRLGAAAWLAAADGHLETWCADEGAARRVVVALPAVDGRAALGLLRSAWQASGAPDLDDLVAAAVAAAHGPAPQVVIDLTEAGTVIGLRVLQPDARTSRALFGPHSAQGQGRERLLAILGGRAPLAIELWPEAGGSRTGIWAPVAG